MCFGAVAGGCPTGFPRALLARVTSVRHVKTLACTTKEQKDRARMEQGSYHPTASLATIKPHPQKDHHRPAPLTAYSRSDLNQGRCVQRSFR